MRFAAFIVRFLAYSLVLWLAYAFAQMQWTNADLDLNDALSGLHVLGVAILTIAPLVLALVAIFCPPPGYFRSVLSGRRGRDRALRIGKVWRLSPETAVSANEKEKRVAGYLHTSIFVNDMA